MEKFWGIIADWLRKVFYPMGTKWIDVNGNEASPVGWANLSFGEILIALALCALVFLLAKWLWEGFFWPGFKAIGHGVNVMFHSAKHRCSKITCKHCGRTLDKCVCENNKNASYNQRLRRYYKELRAARKAAKEAAKKD